MRIHLRGLLLFLVLSSFCFSDALAGTVIKSAGKKVYIKFSKDDSFTEGDLFYLSSGGKKIGLVLLTKVKGFKAIGEVKKGKAVNGAVTEFKGIGKKMKKKSALADDSSSEEPSTSTRRTTRWGLLIGQGFAKQDVRDPSSGTTSSQSGTSLPIKYVYDYPLMETVTVRAEAGVEMFNVSGPNAAGKSIGTKITYGTLDALLKWDYAEFDSFRYYFVGGMGIFYPVSSSSTAIAKNTISSFAIAEIGLGLELKMNGYAIPLEASYYYFPAGTDVKTSIISVKTGILF